MTWFTYTVVGVMLFSFLIVVIKELCSPSRDGTGQPGPGGPAPRRPGNGAADYGGSSGGGDGGGGGGG